MAESDEEFSRRASDMFFHGYDLKRIAFELCTDMVSVLKMKAQIEDLFANGPAELRETEQ